MAARPGASERYFRRETVQVEPRCEPLCRRHRPLAHQIIEVVATGQPPPAEHGLLTHGRQDRAKAGPGDVLVAALDTRDRALAGANPVSEFALAQRMPRAQFLDESTRRCDAVYGIRGSEVHS